jgi:hypothetical protein
MAFCINCGEKLVDGARFCHMCGTPARSSTEIPNQRKQEYIGKILKCPNCGAVITETTAVCPECGVQITGKVAINSIQNFKGQLMEIECTRKRKSGGVFAEFLPADEIDLRKLLLIRNFPIPNSIDDILEFMMLAIANIDVNLSKNTLTNRVASTKTGETSATIDRTISNAWVAKMEQLYRKAEVAFPNDPAFANIQRMYFDKMKELKIKVN